MNDPLNSLIGATDLEIVSQAMAKELEGKGLVVADFPYLHEAVRRLKNYSQVPPVRISKKELGENTTEHAVNLASLKVAAEFFNEMTGIPSFFDLVDFGKPTEKWPAELSASVRRMREEHKNLIALICEIYSTGYSTGGFLFSLGALPKEVQSAVKDLLKSRKLLREDE